MEPNFNHLILILKKLDIILIGSIFEKLAFFSIEKLKGIIKFYKKASFVLFFYFELQMKNIIIKNDSKKWCSFSNN